eukprot:7374813-Pyramimonas_sp.AAC.1
MVRQAQAIKKNIAGTNEVRTIMRFDAHAGRVAQGVPAFFTMSPDERHNLVMVRLSRSRRKGPVNRHRVQEKQGPSND